MMVTCLECQSEGLFDSEIRFVYARTWCKSCGHQHESEWIFRFCDPECMNEWMKKNKVAELGYPCQVCPLTIKPPKPHPARLCHVCGGSGRVKGCTPGPGEDWRKAR